MIYGYARVSTLQQANKGNSLEYQDKVLKEAGAEIIYFDAFTGKKLNRTEFNKLMAEIKAGDTLIITKLDRFARSLSEATELITELIDRGITVNVLNLGVLSNSSMSTLIRNILLSLAQFERELILERTAEGKAIARQKPNYREGRPKKYTKEKLDLALSLLETNSYYQVERMTGVSKSSLWRYKKEKEAETLLKEDCQDIAM